MDLLVQFQCLFYSFLYGFVMSAIYHIINRLLYKCYRIVRYVLQVFIGIAFGILYFYGLVVLNDGVLRFYFFIMVFIGYLLYQKYYAYYVLFYLEICVRILKRILAPFIFFFHSFNAIILKRVKKVKLKWRKVDNQNIKNS
ncbi:MAG: spore cortex biosynthesis protein YabQ [Coprobacillus sp.]